MGRKKKGATIMSEQTKGIFLSVHAHQEGQATTENTSAQQLATVEVIDETIALFQNFSSE